MTFVVDTKVIYFCVINNWFGTTRSRFSLIGHYPRYFIGPSNLNHN
ncbi:hypothetical protein T01_14034 [Trichinella spiralis]|uniref:Uncharacterized protein n=1 Tax=Trichinella spiralis TaxID=6334 RepID=A0A0V0YUU0_TRISP|nr:hypothetical protein T01_14034 [Trichinella spiralis]